MDTIRPVLALMLLAFLSWIAGYWVSLTILRLSKWSPRFHLEERVPPQRYRKINRIIAASIGLIAAAIAMYYTAPETMQSLRQAPPSLEAPPADDVERLIEEE